MAQGAFTLQVDKASLRDAFVTMDKWPDEEARRALELLMEYWQPVLEAFSKRPDMARWKDRSGDARKGLHAEVFDEPDAIGVKLAHSVHYGKWLEVGERGEKYGTLRRTLEANEAAFLQNVMEWVR